MQENKYEGFELTDNAIANVVQIAALRVDGVKSLNLRFYDEVVDGISERLGQKSIRGIKIKQNKNRWEITVYLIAYYDYQLVNLAQQVQEEIHRDLDCLFEIKNSHITVHIADVVKH